MGLIPDPERDHMDAYQKLWRQISDGLKEECKKFGQAASFFDPAQLFVSEMGIDDGYFDVSRRTGMPDIHLNPAGAMILAMGLKTHLQQRPATVFYKTG